MSAIPGIRPRSMRIRVRVDPARCAGHGTCADVAPSLFVVDRFGCAMLTADATRLLETDPEARAAARVAAARCPAAAIIIEDLDPQRSAAAASGGALQPEALSFVRPRLLRTTDDLEPLDEWRQRGGFRRRDPEWLFEQIREAGLRGGGGARFPVVEKWRSIGQGAPVVVANGSEGEPYTRKDQHLMVRRPFLVLDGLLQTARAIGADRAIVAIDSRWRAASVTMQEAVDWLDRVGELSPVSVEVREVPPTYVAGEETALLGALEGSLALPRRRPPFPTKVGVQGRPTVVHNIETLAQIGLIAANDAAWFRAVGAPQEPGTGIFGVGLFGAEPVLHERPLGTPLRRLLQDTGFADATAVVVGGWSGGMVPERVLDVPLTEEALRAVGATLGTKSIQVVSPGRCVVGVVAQIIGYFASETAGQCVPCREGLPWLAAGLAELERTGLSSSAVDELLDYGLGLSGRGLCALPDGPARMLRSLRTHFPDEIPGHALGCPHQA